MFLFEGCADTVDAGIAVQAEGAGVVGDGVPVGVDQDGGFDKFAEDVANGGFLAGVKLKVAPCLSRALMGRRRRERLARILP